MTARPAYFHWKTLSEKQEKILTWWMPNSPVKDYDAIIADGSVRAGKTLPMSLSFPVWAMENFENQNFSMSGKTVGSFRRNVLNLQKKILLGRGYQAEEKRAENLLTVHKNGKTNYFYIFGGKDEGSQDLIQGLTLAGALFDEVALMPESFVNQAVARCSVEGSKLWFNCNPSGPTHWFKKNWIDQARIKKAIYLHFTMEDNLSLSNETRERYKKLFSGLFYKRFILGEWCLAEGIIYDCFDENIHVVNELPQGTYQYYIGIDYGTINPTVFLLIAHHLSTNNLYVVDEYYYDSNATKRQKTDFEYANDLKKFINGRFPQAIYIDPSAASFRIQAKRIGINNIKDADNSVLSGIRSVASLYSQKKLFILRGKCPNFLHETVSYVWDEKAQKQYGIDKPLKQNDHTQDACRYVIFTKFKKLTDGIIRKPKGW